MSVANEYRPRIRVSRKHPVSCKGRFVLVVLRDEAEAEAIALFLTDLLNAAKKEEDAMEKDEATKVIAIEEKVEKIPTIEA